jgi:ABC-type multidrug transport system ATPase subunit
MSLLNLSHLSLKKKNHSILTDISFSIEKGEIVCLCGSNGAGKSTLLQSILGLERNYKGEIEWFGEDLNTVPRIQLLGKIGVMLGNPAFYDFLTGEENLRLLSRYYKLDNQSVAEILAIVGLTEQKHKLVRYYSSGMKQKLNLAAAFIHKPEIILLDEPLNALDPETVMEMRELLRSMNTAFNTTFFITSHSLAETEKIFTRLFVIKEGKIVFEVSKADFEQFMTLKISGGKPENIDSLFSSVSDGISTIIIKQHQIPAYPAEWNVTEKRKTDIEDLYLMINQ